MTNKTEPLHKGQKENGLYIKVQTRVNVGMVRQKKGTVLEKWSLWKGGLPVEALLYN